MRKDMGMVQQGDLVLFRTDKMPDGKPINSNIVHKGDNNTHVIHGSFLICEHEGTTFLQALEDCELGHEEHGLAPKNLRTISKGIYWKHVVNEYDHVLEESRKLID